jgi:pimeloyl-ACP methyl ester carboxylesterase
MRVFLIHGMGRSRASMMFLGSRLARAGLRPSSFGYTVHNASLDAIGARFVTHIAATRAKDAKASAVHDDEAPYAIIGHSLGNVITRHVLRELPRGFARFVMLAPPNRPALLAKKLRANALFRALTGDAGQALGDDAFYAALPRPEVPTLILAGDAGPRFAWLPFGGQPSDGIVALDETKLDDVPHAVLPALHTFIMNNAVVQRAIVRFIETGRHLDASS